MCIMWDTSSSYVEYREPNKQACNRFSISCEFFSDVVMCFVLNRFPFHGNCIGYAYQPSKRQSFFFFFLNYLLVVFSAVTAFFKNWKVFCFFISVGQAPVSYHSSAPPPPPPFPAICFNSLPHSHLFAWPYMPTPKMLFQETKSQKPRTQHKFEEHISKHIPIFMK